MGDVNNCQYIFRSIVPRFELPLGEKWFIPQTPMSFCISVTTVSTGSDMIKYLIRTNQFCLTELTVLRTSLSFLNERNCDLAITRCLELGIREIYYFVD